MAKFRQGHSRSENGKRGRKSKSGLIRLFLMLAILFGFIAYAVKFAPQLLQGDSVSISNEDKINATDSPLGPRYQDPATQVRHFLPSSKLGTPIHHTYYSLSYSEADEQAEWVAYELSRDQLKGNRVPRTDWFEVDKAISTRSAHFEDYRNSGYTKGHMVPAGDMAFSKQAIDETFLMSNMSPQTRGCNGGIWRELEENVREWVHRHGRLVIISGPVLTEPAIDKIGRNDVTVPQSYFKILLIDEPDNEQAVAFHIPNETSEKPLLDYVRSVDEIEKLTGLNFFPSSYDVEQEEVIESRVNLKYWKIDPVRYDRRLKNWNSM